MKGSLIILALIATSTYAQFLRGFGFGFDLTGLQCVSSNVLRSDRVKNQLNPQLLAGHFYENLYSDFAQLGTWRCQEFTREIQKDGSFKEDMSYKEALQDGITQHFEMQYDTTKEPGVYSAHPTFEPIGTPATVVDYAEDGSWMILYKCVSAGSIKITESVEVLSRSEVLSEQETLEINATLVRAKLDKIRLDVVNRKSC